MFQLDMPPDPPASFRPPKSRRLAFPRLLPLTIIGISGLLLLKLVDVTIAWLPDGSRRPIEAAREEMFAVVAHAATPPAEAQREAKAEAPAAAKPEAGKSEPGKAEAGKAEAGKAEAAKAEPPPTAVAPGATEGSAATPIGEVAAQLGPGVSESERALLVDLRARRQELDKRDVALGERANLLAAAELRLNTRLDELKSLQGKLEALEKAREAQTDANMRGLIKVYEDMKPRDAAAIWNDLDMDVLLPLLDRMKESKASALLAAMDPVRAREVTARLAKRRTEATMINASPPTSSPASSALGGNASAGRGAQPPSAPGPVGG
jgi:flagellar motility protein MotE (MotC chaperone)